MNRISLHIAEEERIHLKIAGEMYAVDKDVQEKEAIPSEERQEIVPDYGYLLSKVTVDAIPSNYGRIAWDGTGIMVY